MDDINTTRVSMGVHTVMGIIAGYASMFFEALYSAGLAILILVITGYMTEFILKKKGIKWWMSNGGVLYILVWLVTWVFLFNL